MSSHDPQENRLPSESNKPRLAETHDSRRDESSSQSTGDAVVTDRRYERGLEVYASQFQIPREQVASWFAEHVGERFGEEAILSGAGAWVNDELSLRGSQPRRRRSTDHSGWCRAAATCPYPLGNPTWLHALAA
jgi:hypothetical protein